MELYFSLIWMQNIYIYLCNTKVLNILLSRLLSSVLKWLQMYQINEMSPTYTDNVPVENSWLIISRYVHDNGNGYWSKYLSEIKQRRARNMKVVKKQVKSMLKSEDSKISVNQNLYLKYQNDILLSNMSHCLFSYTWPKSIKINYVQFVWIIKHYIYKLLSFLFSPSSHCNLYSRGEYLTLTWNDLMFIPEHEA